MSHGPVQVVFAESRLCSVLLLSLWSVLAGSNVLHVLKIVFQRLLSGPIIIQIKIHFSATELLWTDRQRVKQNFDLAG
jgi:hypothetical protein